MSVRILIISGERSGDQYASALINELYKQNSSIKVFAWGGKFTKTTPAKILKDHTELGEMGFTAILKRPVQYYNILKEAKSHLLTYQITHFIGVDFSGLNLRVADKAKILGIRTIQLIAPKTWAYASYRNQKIQHVIDDLIVFFPFEKKYFSDRGIRTHYVGNPLTDKIKPNRSIEEKFEYGLFPGSRLQEVEKILPVMLDVINTLKQKAIIGATREHLDTIKSMVRSHPANQFITITTDYLKAMHESKLCLCTSGTITLEAALMDKNQIVLYKTHFVNYRIAKALIKISYISLPNIISNKRIVPEFIQKHCNPDKIVEFLLENRNMKINYNTLRKELINTKETLVFEEIAKVITKK